MKLKVGLAGALIIFIAGLVFAWRWRIQDHRLEPLAAVTALAVRPNPPDGWKKIDEDGKFSFYLPPEMKHQEEVGNIDYLGPHKSFADKTLEVFYFYVEKQSNEELWRGRVSCEYLMKNLREDPGWRSMEVETGGKKASQASGQFSESKLVNTILCFPDAGAGLILRLGTTYEEERAGDAAKIIGSIEFP